MERTKDENITIFVFCFSFPSPPFFFNIPLSSFFFLTIHSLSSPISPSLSLLFFFLTAISDFSPFPMTHTPSSSTSIFLILKILKGDSVRNKLETTPSLYLSSLSFFFFSLSLTLSVPSFLRLFELSSRPRIEFCTFSSWSFFFCTKEKKTERKKYKHNLTSKESSETLEKSGGKRREREERKRRNEFAFSEILWCSIFFGPLTPLRFLEENECGMYGRWGWIVRKKSTGLLIVLPPPKKKGGIVFGCVCRVFVRCVEEEEKKKRRKGTSSS
jgi:hypothetical protein